MRRRFVYYEENSIALEAGTAGALILFFWVETTVLKYALGPQMLLYFFAILGLVVAGFALYAHVMISLASRLLVEMVAPGDGGGPDQPRFGPVESLERSEDFEGALQEYLVLARIYPRNFEVLTRTARVNEILERPDEAVAWYMRARKRAADERDALTVVNRLCSLYDTELESPDEADAQLMWFMETYPNALDVSIVRDRLERRAVRADASVSAQLEALEANPLTLEGELEISAAFPMQAEAEQVESLDTPPGEQALGEAPPKTPEPPVSVASPPSPPRLSLDSLQQVAVSGEPAAAKAPQRSNGHKSASPASSSTAPARSRAKQGDTEKPKAKPSGSNLLQALDEVVSEDTPPEAPVQSPEKPRLSLESMDGDGSDS